MLLKGSFLSSHTCTTIIVANYFANVLRLAGFHSIRADVQAAMHDIKALLAMARRQPQPNPY
ncbi:hypothetical protein VB716_07510 [Synechococcus sp. CCY9201]|uniref:hypothetical protein n=1 Tax=Synechococcus sp. CCY9201 TaxID=174697 RepID=UPI002B1F22D5|nr:hypothetical protein [Synechococcus sp. CCY9201]MEA5474069.1 hypothetical protein [Synechococcus sp. CCY9201]